MEGVLNIAWLLTVVGIILATSVGSRCGLRQRLPLLIAAFACIALLLFPVISASDDLHPSSDWSDDAAWRHHQHILGVHVLAWPLLISIPSVLLCRACLLPAVRLAARSHSGYLRRAAGRAPPQQPVGV
jgi:hypothetical protein